MGTPRNKSKQAQVGLLARANPTHGAAGIDNAWGVAAVGYGTIGALQQTRHLCLLRPPLLTLYTCMAKASVSLLVGHVVPLQVGALHAEVHQLDQRVLRGTWHTARGTRVSCQRSTGQGRSHPRVTLCCCSAALRLHPAAPTWYLRSMGHAPLSPVRNTKWSRPPGEGKYGREEQRGRGRHIGMGKQDAHK